MKTTIATLLLPLSCFLLLNGCAIAQRVNYKKEIRFAAHQQKLLLSYVKALDDTIHRVSPRAVVNNQLVMVIPHDWTSGFFAGNLWFLYEATQNNAFLAAAVNYTNKLAEEQFDTKTHDLGFIVNNSFGHGYRLVKKERYKEVIINAAKSLSSRFNPKVGLIKSWDHGKDNWTYPVIIDNMMNLELLFNATKLSGDSSFYKIAVQHANNTLKNQFRKDHSSYHVVDYNLENGTVIKKITAQGFSNESSWSRGEAWALYGFTTCFEETKDSAYLAQAIQSASYIIGQLNLAEDFIPFWDFRDPDIPNTYKDASAAAITAAALFKLSAITQNKLYRKSADKLLWSLARHYKSKKNENYGFILDHSVGFKAINSEVNVPLIYADYYFIEALLSGMNFR